MALKFRKRLKIFPGFYVNLSKSGMSATIGMRGLSVNIGPKGAYLNTGIPGTGLYDRQRIDLPTSHTSHQLASSAIEISEIKSLAPVLITSEGLEGLKEAILQAQQEKAVLLLESKKATYRKWLAQLLLWLSYLLIVGFFFPQLRRYAQEKTQEAREAQAAYKNFKLDIEMNLDAPLQSDYANLKKAFEELMTIEAIWDITAHVTVRPTNPRSRAKSGCGRLKVSFSKGTLDYVAIPFEALKLSNANGGDLYLYPGFLLMTGPSETDFALIDFSELNIEHGAAHYSETETIPKDTKIIGKTWQHVTKQGQPDRRYRYNPEIPIVHYYEMTLKTDKGLHESYLFSNPEVAERFCRALTAYQATLKKMNWVFDLKSS